MAVREIAFKYSAKGANAVRRSDKKVQSQVNKTAKEARQSTGDINRWMEANKSALQAIGLAATGALAGILSQSPTLRAELASARIALTLLADTIINNVLPSGGGLTDMLFRLEHWFAELDDPVQSAISNFLVFAAGAKVAARFLHPVAGAVTILFGAYRVLNDVLPQSAALLGAVGVAAAIAFVMIAPWAAAIMLVVGSLIVLAGWLYRNRDAIRDWVAGLRDAFMNWLGRVVARGLLHISNLRDGISSRLEAAKDRAITFARLLYFGVKVWLANLRDDAFAWGRAVIDRFISGMESARSSLANVASTLKEEVTSRLDISDLGFGGISGILSKLVNVLDKINENINVNASGGTTNNLVNAAPSGGAGGGSRTVSVGEISVNVSGTGASRTDGRNIAQEVSKEINNQFESRR